MRRRAADMLSRLASGDRTACRRRAPVASGALALALAVILAGPVIGAHWLFLSWAFVSLMALPVSAHAADMRAGSRTARRRRADRTGRELLLLMAFVLAAAMLALASAEAADSKAAGPARADRPLPTTVSVDAPSRALPAALAAREFRIEQLEPLAFPELVGRVAETMGVEAALEERPGRVAGEHVVHAAPVPFGLVMTGTAPAVLDEVARLSGYDWTWNHGRLVFFRHADSEQRRAASLPSGVAVGLLAAIAENEAEAAKAGGKAKPDREAAAGEDGERPHAEMDPERRVASGVPGRVEAGPGGRVGAKAGEALEGQAEAAPAERAPREPVGWEVDPERHGTVEGVLRAWAERAGWQLAWETDRTFEVGAAAVFPGGEDEEEGFLAAADALLAIAPMRRLLSVTAYPNRWLVVRDVGSAAE